jgi:hypothetical protein
VELLNANTPVIFAARDMPNGRVFLDIVGRRTTTLICARIADSDGVALISIGLTLRSGILMLTATTY